MRAALVIVAALSTALLVVVLWPQPEHSTGGTLDVTELLGAGDAAGFERAEGRRTFSFPQDHGPHPGYRTEWWYFTGNLATDGGRAFGYQLTFFRNALAPEQDAGSSGGIDGGSAWATRQVYMSHVAISDLGGRHFFAEERFSRAALGMAGAQGEPFRVWLEDLEVRAIDGDFFPLQLSASAEDAGLSLIVERGKPPVLQGDGGLSPKGPGPGNASWYYSFTRLPTHGEFRLGDRVFVVQGESWMDREWSTSLLGPNLVGWDWFSLQLSNGWDLMLFQLRTTDGGVDPFSAGTLVRPDGESLSLTQPDFALTPLRWWTSPRSRTRYPIGWRVEIPGRGVSLEVEAAQEDQELDVSVRYWEGAVRANGTFDDEGVTARGYLEMTGYSGPSSAATRAR